MAIAFDAVSTGSGTTSFSWNHTCSGANRILFVAVGQDTNSGSGAVTGITYNGVAMTQLSNSPQTSSNGARIYVFYLVAPATGTNSIAVTTGASPGFAQAGAVSYTGVSQTAPLGTPATAGATSTTPSVNVTSAADELVLDFATFWGSGGTRTVGADQTQRVNATNTTAYMMMSQEAGAASVTMSWSMSSVAWRTIGVAIKPPAEDSDNFFAFF